MNITIGFSTTNKFMSKVIRFLTRSKVSHTWIAFDDMTLGMRMVLQAEVWGFEVRPLKRWKNENILVAEFEPIGNDLIEAFYYITDKLGLKYDYESAILTGIWAWIKRLFRIGIKTRSLQSPNKLMCSESVIRFLQKANYKIVENLDPEITAPGNLLNLICNSSEFIKKTGDQCG